MIVICDIVNKRHQEFIDLIDLIAIEWISAKRLHFEVINQSGRDLVCI